MNYNPDVLLVGTYHGIKGQYSTIQAAVDAAKPGNWILIAPGDYHETDDLDRPPTPGQVGTGEFGGVLIETPNVHVRGMDRNTTIIDGDTADAPKPCDSGKQYQTYGTKNAKGEPIGRNGITAYQADNVSIENLTVCNFRAGAAGKGFQIWWDGGEDSGKIGMNGYWGNYLTATSTYYAPPPANGIDTNSTYGIYANSAGGPAGWDNVYASNMNDSGAYVGACPDCDMTIDHSWFEYNAQGYSGTNSGGSITIQHSEFDHNRDGLDTDTQIGSDPPPIQDGRCAGSKTKSCWVFQNNTVHDNNNADVPSAGTAAGVPVGTGMTISGGRWDTVKDNDFRNNGGWGVLFLFYPDTDKPWGGKTCADYGGVPDTSGLGLGCVLPSEGDALIDNTFETNGTFGNPTNGDYGEFRMVTGKPRNCFSGNKDGGAPASSTPSDLETTEPTCDGTLTTTQELQLLNELACAVGKQALCPKGSKYPTVQPGHMVPMRALPKLASMPDPCKDVPKYPWCPNP